MTFAEQYDRSAREGARMREGRGLAPGQAAAASDVEARLAAPETAEPALTTLAVAARDGEPGARERLVEQALPLIQRYAARYAGRDLERADLIQEGVVGVLRALSRFDADRGVPFTAYAGWWLRQAMQQAIAEQSRAVRLPTHVLWDIHALKEARGAIAQREGRDATTAELVRELGWGRGRYEDVSRAERPAVSLDAPYAGDESEVDSLGDLLADPLSEQSFADVLDEATAPAVRALLSTLSERERQVLAWRFGEGVDEPLTLQQVGRRLGVSAERVRQIENRALAKLETAALSGG
ncbi:MAG TPA: RNA polymerase sigma factor RpoD/SigA [Gaiellales bacterium]|nr:RNA polymerase sigma factor RpoD/SigA [Gaiellales bacterium]